MTYIASPKTQVGTAERVADCYQCVSSALSTQETSNAADVESELVAAAVEVGWSEEEIRLALVDIRSENSETNESSWNRESSLERQQPSPPNDLVQARPLGSGSRGEESAQGLRESVEDEERRIERQKGSPLAKGEERFEERSRSSDGRSAGDKQNPEG